MEKFTFFYRGYLGQWYRSPFIVEDILYTCTEKWMMAGKAKLFNDLETLNKIMAADMPRVQKNLGRQVKNFDLKIWNLHARAIVYEGNKHKFNQHPNLKKLLLETAGTTLVEASPSDDIWGIALGEDDPRALQRSLWRGTNWLGETLTKLRDDFLKEEFNNV